MWNAGMPDTISLLFLLLAGLLVAVSYTLYAKASTGLSALETVLIPIIDPVMNPVWVFLFLDERPGGIDHCGCSGDPCVGYDSSGFRTDPIFSVSDKRVVSVLSMVT